MPDEAWTPLLFVRTRSPARTLAEAQRSRSATLQRIAIARWAEQEDRALTQPLWVVRARAPYRPDQDWWLRDNIRSAMADGRMLVMDDFFRFVDGCDVSDASRIVTGLLALKPPIFSVRHGAPLDGIAPAIFKHEIESRALDYRSRSERGKLAAADGENLQPAPSPKARRQAILVRQQLAQQRAQRLLEDLERVRASMPHTEREKLSAVARALNEAEIAPPSGAGRWQGTTVKRVLERAGQSTGE